MDEGEKRDCRLTNEKLFPKFEQLLNNESGGVFVFEVEEGYRLRPIYIGSGYFDYLKSAELQSVNINDDFLNCCAEYDRAELRHLISYTLSHDTVTECSFHILDKDGNHRQRIARAVRVTDFDDANRPIMLIAVHDVETLKNKRVFGQQTELLNEISDSLSFFKIRLDDKFTLLSCNRRYCNFLGYADWDELVKNGATDSSLIIDKNNLNDIRRQIAKGLSSPLERVNTDIKLITPDGIKWLTAWGSFVQEHGENVLVACAIDTTKQKLLDDEFHYVLDSINGGFIIWSVSASNEIAPSVISSGYSNMLGYSVKELMELYKGRPYAHLHKDDLEAAKKTISSALSTANSDTDLKISLVHRLMKQDNAYVWVKVNILCKKDPLTSAYKLFTNYTDITELKTAEKELIMREKAYFIASAQCGKAISRYDIKNRILYQNENFDASSYSNNVVRNVPESVIRIGVVAAQSVAAYRDFFARIASGVPYGEATVMIKNKPQGNFEWFRLDYSTIYDDDSQPSYAIISHENIDTEYKVTLAKQLVEERCFRRRLMLIVDDIELNRAVLKDIFEDAFQIIEAEDGEQALSYIADYGARISVVLLDIVMPKLSGIDVLKEMRKHPEWSAITTIIVSGGEETDYGADIIKLGAAEFLRKGETREVVRLRVSSALEKRAAEQLRYENAVLQANKSEDERHTRELQHIAETDSVTGLLNRPAFTKAVASILRGARPNEYIICALDMDNFSVYNDMYGFDEGDKLLKRMAEDIEAFASAHGGICCRTHSDNFLCIAKYVSSVFDDDSTTEKSFFNGYPLSFNYLMRVGKYIINDMSISINSIIDRAVIAKRSIKGLFQKHEAFYTEAMRDKLLLEQSLTNDAQDALDNDDFKLYLQPKYSISQNKIVGAEALVRWIHPAKGFLSPGAFIPVFEHNGLIVKLDEYIWEHTARLIRKWLDNGHPVVPVSVNISRMNIYNPNLIQTLTSIVKKYDLDPKLFELELTESAYVQNQKQFIDIVNELHEHGFVIAMDDFGSGYSSLSALRDITVDIVKLDIRFMPPDNEDVKSKSILVTMANLAQMLKLGIVAEGVETKAQVDYLHSISCDTVQGFYFAKPMPIAEFEAMIEQTNKK